MSPFIREFNELFGDLDQRLDDLGVPGGQPFLISPNQSDGRGIAVAETVRLCRLFGWERGRDAECEDAGLGLVA
ncbi:hypothetical protein [Streptomyces sp. Ag82_O1-15]|uniref:hypothetical protein n=1 Tax=Streptomyces sp. Ag82_O1-15 TaxID=1938855 RepID=UPI000BB1504B|nr:hypothetical protein [Streptomyces sp. Ag82_O1-15]